MALFGRPKYTIVRLKKKDIPDGLWTKCEACSETLYNKTIEENLKVCPKCGHHFSLGAYERIRMLVDKDTFEEYDKDMLSADPLDFKGPKTYKDKIASDQKITGLNDQYLRARRVKQQKVVAVPIHVLSWVLWVLLSEKR